MCFLGGLVGFLVLLFLFVMAVGRDMFRLFVSRRLFVELFGVLL